MCMRCNDIQMSLMMHPLLARYQGSLAFPTETEVLRVSLKLEDAIGRLGGGHDTHSQHKGISCTFRESHMKQVDLTPLGQLLLCL